MGAAEDLYREICEGGYARIARFESGAQEEHLHLDFKGKADAETGLPDKDDKRNYSEALSGFANSAGGVIVWGIDARKGEQIQAIL